MPDWILLLTYFLLFGVPLLLVSWWVAYEHDEPDADSRRNPRHDRFAGGDAMSVTVHFYSLNDEHYNTDLTATLGPFEYVQMTYGALRNPDGDTIAIFNIAQEDWQLVERVPIEGSKWADNIPVGEHFSDMEIRAMRGV